VPRRWLLGYGPDTFAEVYPSGESARSSQGREADATVDDPHNLILNHLTAAGVLGLLAFSYVVASFYKSVLGAFGRGANRQTEATLAAVAASATAYLIQAQFNPDVIVLSALFWLCLAIGVALSRRGGLAKTGSADAAMPLTKIAERSAAGGPQAVQADIRTPRGRAHWSMLATAHRQTRTKADVGGGEGRIRGRRSAT